MASRSASPEPPPMSPITPTETPSSPNPQHAAAATAAPSTATNPPTSINPPPQSLTHTTHPSSVPSQPAPPPEPIDFDTNSDAIALRSAISVLQLQRKKADNQIRLLSASREEAVSDPQLFADRLEAAQRSGSTADLPWKDAFVPQNIGHCPQINWDQYAIVGEPLGALEQEQVRRPPTTEPSVYINGEYKDVKSAAGPARPGGRADEYRGPLAPYSPWLDKDKIDKRPNPRK